MTLEIRLRPEAEQDLGDAAAWYEEQRQGLGHEFIDEVLIILSNIADTSADVPGCLSEHKTGRDSTLSIQCVFSSGKRDDRCCCNNTRESESTQLEESHISISLNKSYPSHIT